MRCMQWPTVTSTSATTSVPLTRQDVASKASIKEVIREQIVDYEEAMEGARERLANALEIIVTAYYAALIKRSSDEMLANLMSTY